MRVELRHALGAITRIFTTGFTGKRAEQFFGELEDAGIRRLVDIRLRNSSQLAGFTKTPDLSFFLHRVAGIEYAHEPLLAPTPEILDAYRKQGLSWDDYESAFIALMEARDVATTVSRSSFTSPSVLLCSEPTPERCHRRLVAEYLQDAWGDVEIVHL